SRAQSSSPWLPTTWDSPGRVPDRRHHAPAAQARTTLTGLEAVREWRSLRLWKEAARQCLFSANGNSYQVLPRKIWNRPLALRMSSRPRRSSQELCQGIEGKKPGRIAKKRHRRSRLSALLRGKRAFSSTMFRLFHQLGWNARSQQDGE